MKAKLLSIGMAAALVAAGLPAFAASLSPNDRLGTTEAAVRSSLKKMGATVEELDTGKGLIEAQYSMGGTSHEATVDTKTGKVISIDASGDDAAGDK